VEVRYPTERQQIGMFTVPMWLIGFGWVMWSEPKLTWYCIGVTVAFSPLLYTFGRLAILHFRTRDQVLKWDQVGISLCGPEGELWYVPWQRLSSLERRRCIITEFGGAFLRDVAGNEYDLHVPVGDDFKPKSASDEFWIELTARVGKPEPVRSVLVEKSIVRFRVLLGIGVVLCAYTAVALVIILRNDANREALPIWLAPTADGAMNLGVIAITFGFLCRPKNK